MRAAGVAFLVLVIAQAAFAGTTTKVSPPKAEKKVAAPKYVKKNYVILDGQCSGDAICQPIFYPATYQEPKYQCPEGFLLGNYYGGLKCIKKNHVCPKGLVKEGTQCCEACPTNCEVKDGYCYAPAIEVCNVQKTVCPADCHQTMVCPGKGAYGFGTDKKVVADDKNAAKVYAESFDPKYDAKNCQYQCCKTTNPAFPMKCYDSTVEIEWCDPTILCPKGSGLDKVSSKCLISQGGWESCPKGSKACACGGATGKPVCTSAKSYFGIDACKLLCPNLSYLQMPECAPASYAAAVDAKAKNSAQAKQYAQLSKKYNVDELVGGSRGY